jgi:hypothetical protein
MASRESCADMDLPGSQFARGRVPSFLLLHDVRALRQAVSPVPADLVSRELIAR